MIERCMHFIWIGNHIPEYGLKNIDAFCKMNLSFACNVVHIPDVKHISDNRHAMIWDQVMNSYGQYLPTIEYYRMIGRHDNQVFSNVLRYDILNQNGGIYLDLDCVPCNPFDEQYRIEKEDQQSLVFFYILMSILKLIMNRATYRI